MAYGRADARGNARRPRDSVGDAPGPCGSRQSAGPPARHQHAFTDCRGAAALPRSQKIDGDVIAFTGVPRESPYISAVERRAYPRRPPMRDPDDALESEPTLDDVLAEPMVRAVMSRDRVEAED